MNPITLRLCKTWDECLQCEEIQQQVWETPDYRDVVPAHFLITAVKNGGLLVGAFDGDKMVGFAFGFLGYDGYGDARHLKHASHMLAVLPDLRAHGLGADLKWLQRAEAVRQGLDLMTWTYDPLQSINAHLNLTRLGAIARRYYRDAYGDMTDALNIGLASDRFEVEWILKSARVERRRTSQPAPGLPPAAAMIYRVEWQDPGFPVIADENPLQGERLCIEIPADINAMKRTALPLAIQWRAHTRSTLERAFAAGYVANGTVRETQPDGRTRFWYALELHPTGVL